MGKAFPVIQDHVRKMLNLQFFTATNEQILQIFNTIDQNKNELIDRQEFYNFLRRQYSDRGLRRADTNLQAIDETEDTNSLCKSKDKFEGSLLASTDTPDSPTSVNSLSDTRKLVEQKRNELEPFDYEPSPTPDGVSRVKRPRVKLESGAKYEGEWSESGRKDGRGMQVHADGSIYEGYWKDDLAEGSGRLIHADGDVYTGEWKEDKAHGYGIYIYQTGATYEGQWCEDNYHGEGKEKWPDNSSYVGTYEEGKKHGSGKFIWADQSVFEGNFIDNDIQGIGTYTWPDGRMYSGQWSQNQMHGDGVFSWADGRKYVGEYINGLKEGHGVFTWPEGKSYDG